MIIEQRERAFTGRKTHSEGEEGFFGAILADGRNLLLTDDGDGYSIGSILDTDLIEVAIWKPAPMRRCSSDPREAPVGRVHALAGPRRSMHPRFAAAT